MIAPHRKRWLITGVSSGLGRAVAEAALKRGDQVVGTVRTATALAGFNALAPGAAIGMLLDVTDAAAVREVLKSAEARMGGIDTLVLNAGYGLVGGVEETSLAEARAQFEVNVFGVLSVMQAALPGMRARKAGHIIAITSVSGLVGWPSLGVYSGSKFALEGLCETLAQEAAPLGIAVTMIEPGGLRTDFGGRSRVDSAHRIDDYDATVGNSRRILAEHRGQEPGDPRKAAEAILAAADSDKPPLRLLLGSDALRYAIAKLEAQRADIETWKALSLSTDY